MQLIIMTSDKTIDKMNGFFYLWQKYANFKDFNIITCGFEIPKADQIYQFYSIGQMSDYPQNKWSDAFTNVLDNIADEVFLFLMDDFWPVRQVDVVSLKMMYDYMIQFQYVLKMDVTTERLYSNTPAAPEECPGIIPVNQFYWGHNTYDVLGHLDLIKSSPTSAYHMSLWGGFFNRDLLKKILVPGETAQEIEINGTRRLQEMNDKMIVLGTRQAPLRHANVQQAGVWNEDENVGLPSLKENDRVELKRRGYIET